ncbi:hypothetical protein EVAR_94966_1 [Eumeta japonica]|uniref:Uncharacterized protein n=1 Tax=Eumeta variegata TaxID=151549 RepID=A0A4C1UVV7_EUMVA|nr:hypothetical protein EVAR_94966_1 [Eumeta japonica]
MNDRAVNPNLVSAFNSGPSRSGFNPDRVLDHNPGPGSRFCSPSRFRFRYRYRSLFRFFLPRRRLVSDWSGIRIDRWSPLNLANDISLPLISGGSSILGTFYEDEVLQNIVIGAARALNPTPCPFPNHYYRLRCSAISLHVKQNYIGKDALSRAPSADIILTS